MSRQSLQDQPQPVKRDSVIPRTAGRSRRRDPGAHPAPRHFVGGWHVPGVGVCKVFAVGDQIEWRVPLLNASARAIWEGYRPELEEQAQARLTATQLGQRSRAALQWRANGAAGR